MNAQRKTIFTDEQSAVIHHDDGHALVNAVPGSGKTTALVGRMRRLVRDGMPAERLLAVMFNVDARQQYQRRLRAALGDSAALPDVRTFHSIGNAIYRRLVERGALKPAKLVTHDGTLAGRARKALNEAWRERNGDDARPRADHYASFKEFIGLAKSQIVAPADVFDEFAYASDCRPFIRAFDLFERERANRGEMYYDDMIYAPVLRMRDAPELWQLFADRYLEIEIDELQDISPIQFEMIQGLAGKDTRMIGVGDPDQAIYGWRGSSVELITKGFAARFSPCTEYPMTRTFRFGHALALSANHLIVKNRDRHDHLVVAAPGTPATSIEHAILHPKKPSGIVEILAPHRQAGTLHQAMMLVRYFAHSIPFELELYEAGIPFFVAGRESLIFLPEVAAMVAALSIATQHWVVPEETRERFLSALVGTPATYAYAEEISLVVDRMVEEMDRGAQGRLADPLRNLACSVRANRPNIAKNLDARADLIELLVGGAYAQLKPIDAIEAYLAITSLRDTIQRQALTQEAKAERMAVIDGFLQIASRSASIEELLDTLGPMAAEDRDKPPAGDHLTITSIHRAKGLERSLILLPGWISGTFPVAIDRSSLEEERRLAFVAMTRAIDRLVFFHPADPQLEDWMKDTGAPPERNANATRVASPYLYDAELGLSQHLARAIDAGAPASLKARNADVATRYLAEVGCAGVTIQSTGPQGPAESLCPIPFNYEPRIGQTLWHVTRGPCVVVEKVRHPVYRMKDEQETLFYDALIDNGEWQCEEGEDTF